MSWRAAHSITSLRRYLNARFPNRSKLSDGIVGDLRHRRSKSDHNPNRKGVVRAFDVTHDPKNGLDCNILASALIKSRDPRIKYIIWDWQILSSLKSPWTWRKYRGSNGHTKHLHISVNEHNYDDTTPWELDFGVASTVPIRPALIEFGDSGAGVESVQKDLSILGYMPDSDIDGEYGPNTRQYVRNFQKDQGLDVDGIVGEATRGKLTELVKTLQEAGTQKETLKIEIEEESEPVTAIAPAEVPTQDTKNDEQPPSKNTSDETPLEVKTVVAPEKEHSTKKSAQMTIAGIAVPSFLVGIFKAGQEAVEKGWVDMAAVFGAVGDFIQHNMAYAFGLIGLMIGLLAIKKVSRQVTLWVKMWIKSDPKRHDMEVKPQ